MRTSFRIPFAAAALSAAFTLLAPAAAQAQAQPQAAGSRVVMAMHFSLLPRWLDPSESLGNYTGHQIALAVHDALLKPLPGNWLSPSLAESWSMSRDGLTYEFKLRRNLKFHNGDPVTSADVKFSFERYKAPATSLIKSRVKEIQTPSPEVVRFVLTQPWPDFVTNYCGLVTSACYVLPKKYIEQVGDAGFAKQPIGAGPYKVASVTPGVEMTLEAYDGYWRKKPSVKTIVMKSVTDETTRAAMLKNGEADYAYVISGPVARDVQKTPNLKLQAGLPAALMFITMTDQFKQGSPWADPRVRQAANLAIDRKAMNDATYLGMSKEISSIALRTMEFAWTPPPYPHDIAKAKALLAEAGFPNGFDGGPFYVDTSYAQYAEIAANDLAAIGIRTRLTPVERASFFAQWIEKKLNGGLILSAVGGFGNAASWLDDYVRAGGKYVYQTYPEVDELFKKQAVELNTTARAKQLEDMQKVMYQKSMFVPLVEIIGINGIGPKITDSAIGKVPGFFFSYPYEDIQKRD